MICLIILKIGGIKMSGQEKEILINDLKRIYNLICGLEYKQKKMLLNLENALLIDGKTINYMTIHEMNNGNLNIKKQITDYINNIMNN